MSKQQMKTSYENILYQIYKEDTNKIIQQNFIDDWMRNNPKQRCYEDVSVFPNEVECPPTHFNLWRKFDMEHVHWVVPNPELIQ